MTTLSIVLAIIKAIPALKEVWDQLIAAYIAEQIKTIKAEYRDAIRKAIYDHDQRALEHAIDSPHAGKESGIPGASIVDHIDGV